MSLEVLFPNLTHDGYRITSPSTLRYNCLAWAAGHDDAWWEPDPEGECFWPPGVTRAITLAAFVEAYISLGFTLCADAAIEPGFDKIALYAKAGIPTHAALQLLSGRWTSKLGMREDIEHSLDGLTGFVYGSVAHVLKRPTPSTGRGTE